MASSSKPQPAKSKATTIVGAITAPIGKYALDSHKAIRDQRLEEKSKQIFPRQQNPKPIQFGGPSERPEDNDAADHAAPSIVHESVGWFAEKSPGLICVSGGGTSVTMNLPTNPVGLVAPIPTNATTQQMLGIVEAAASNPPPAGQGLTPWQEAFMRSIAIDAVYDMSDILAGRSVKGEKLPVAMSVLLAKAKTSNGRIGWQYFIHSSSKFRPATPTPGTAAGSTTIAKPPKAPAVATVHPLLQARLTKAKLKHHFNNMCAETAVISNYLAAHPEAMDKETGKVSGIDGSKVYLITYNTEFATSSKVTGPRTLAGRFFIPCVHSEKNCAQRFNHNRPGINAGCLDVLKLLGIEPLGAGTPSEEDKAVIREEIERERALGLR